MKTTPIDLQASCSNVDTYIFNEELLQCSALLTGLLEYRSVLRPLKLTDPMAFLLIECVFPVMSDEVKLRSDSSHKDI